MRSPDPDQTSQTTKVSTSTRSGRDFLEQISGADLPLSQDFQGAREGPLHHGRLGTETSWNSRQASVFFFFQFSNLKGGLAHRIRNKSHTSCSRKKQSTLHLLCFACHISWVKLQRTQVSLGHSHRAHSIQPPRLSRTLLTPLPHLKFRVEQADSPETHTNTKQMSLSERELSSSWSTNYQKKQLRLTNHTLH